MNTATEELKTTLDKAASAQQRTLRNVNLIVFIPAVLGMVFLAYSAWQISDLEKRKTGLQVGISELESKQRILVERNQTLEAQYKSLALQNRALGAINVESEAKLTPSENVQVWENAIQKAQAKPDVRQALTELAEKVTLPSPQIQAPSSGSQANIYVQYQRSFGSEK